MSDRQRSVGPMYVLFQMLAFVLWLCVNAIFSTLGGLLGAMMFRKDTPPGVVDVAQCDRQSARRRWPQRDRD